MKNYAKYLAEFLGTFALTLVVSLSLAGTFPVSTPVLAAITVGIFVYTVGHISGAHFNPAITLGALSIGKMKMVDALGYWAVQFAGAGVACLLAGRLVDRAVLSISDEPVIGLAEGLGTFFLAFGIAAVIYGRIPKDVQGVTVGGSLLMGVSIAAAFTNGAINPAVALGIGSFGLWYIVGPMIGGVLGMWTYKCVSEEKR